MTTDILPANSVLLPFIVFLVPFFGVTNFMASAFAAMLLPLAVSVVWLCLRWFFLGKQSEKRVILYYVGEQCSPLRLGDEQTVYNGTPRSAHSTIYWGVPPLR